MGFHFVDHITELGGDTGRGTLSIPASLGPLPHCLLAEALGQLAGWLVLERTGFAWRPIAARAHEVRLLRQLRPGETALLEVRIRRLTRDAVRYDAGARCGQQVLLEIGGSIGPLIPAEQLEDPQATRGRFEVLRSAGRQSIRESDALPSPPAGLGECSPASADTWTAPLRVPRSAPFFADHFPRRPVYPATLLLDALARVARAATAGLWGRPLEVVEPILVRRMRVRAFTPPGDELQIVATKARTDQVGDEWAVAALARGEEIAAAQVTTAARQ